MSPSSFTWSSSPAEHLGLAALRLERDLVVLMVGTLSEAAAATLDSLLAALPPALTPAFGSNTWRRKDNRFICTEKKRTPKRIHSRLLLWVSHSCLLLWSFHNRLLLWVSRSRLLLWLSHSRLLLWASHSRLLLWTHLIFFLLLFFDRFVLLSILVTSAPCFFLLRFSTSWRICFVLILFVFWAPKYWNMMYCYSFKVIRVPRTSLELCEVTTIA